MRPPCRGPPKEGRAPGVAFWLPRLSPTPLSGTRAREAAEALRRGGASARVVRDVGRDRAFAGSLLNVLMAELEVAGWSRESLNGLIRTADEFEMAVPHLRRLGDRLGAR